MRINIWANYLCRVFLYLGGCVFVLMSHPSRLKTDGTTSEDGQPQLNVDIAAYLRFFSQFCKPITFHLNLIEAMAGIEEGDLKSPFIQMMIDGVHISFLEREGFKCNPAAHTFSSSGEIC